MAVPVLDAENDDFIVIEDGAMKKKDVIVYSEDRLDLKGMGHKDSMVKHEKRLEPGGIKDNDPIINHKMSLAKYESRDKDIIDDNHKKRLYLEGMTNTNVNSACLDDHSTHTHEDAPYLQSNQRNTKPSYIVLLIVFVSVMTVLKQWIQNVLEGNYSNSLNSCLEWTKELNNKECPDKTAMKQWIHNFVKTFHYISQGSYQTYMLYPQDYGKFIDERSTSSSSSSLKEAMQFEWCRLSSFANFPKINISVIRLSEAGFYYQGNEDEVVCFFCGLKHNHWKSTDNPKQIHVELSPNCPFVMKNMNTITSTSNDLNNNSSPTGSSVAPTGGSAAPSGGSAAPTGSSVAPSGACGNQDDVEQVARGNARDTHNSSKNRVELGNVANSQLNDSSACNLCVTPENEETKTEKFLTPKTENIEVISSLQSTTNQTESVSFSRNDTTGLIRVPQASFITGPVVRSQQLSSAASSALSLEPNNMGVCVDKPKYPKYAIRATRVSSFTNWPEYLAQKPEELALAGFFYTGTDDHCRCFFCGGGLRRWEAEDLPWTEHARWYPKCSFVMQCKGSKFIEDVLQGRDPERALKQEEQSSAGVNGYSNNPVVQTILQLGIEPDLVKATYTTLKNSGIEDITATLLLETIYEIEDSTNKPTTSDRVVETGPTHVTKSTEQTNNIPVPEHKPTVDPSLELSIQSLENENRNLRDQQTCKICLDEPVAIVFLPCGHMAACVNCAPALRRCPICRAFIKGTVKAIMC